MSNFERFIRQQSTDTMVDWLASGGIQTPASITKGVAVEFVLANLQVISPTKVPAWVAEAARMRMMGVDNEAVVLFAGPVDFGVEAGLPVDYANGAAVNTGAAFIVEEPIEMLPAPIDPVAGQAALYDPATMNNDVAFPEPQTFWEWVEAHQFDEPLPIDEYLGGPGINPINGGLDVNLAAQGPHAAPFGVDVNGPDPNATVMALQDRVGAFENQIQALLARIDAHDLRLGGQDAQITEIRNKVSGIEGFLRIQHYAQQVAMDVLNGVPPQAP